MRLSNKVAIITGGASGIGEATARLFVREGARVAIFDMQDERGEAVAAELAGDGKRAAFFHCNVGDAGLVEAAVEATIAEFGTVDVLFNNAGAQPRIQVPLEEVDEDEWYRVLDSHLKGVLLCSRAVVGEMKRKERGVIVNTASHAGFVAMPKNHSYTAAKHGIVGLTKSLALELAPFGIRVCAVAPGAIDTPMLRRGADALAEDRVADISSRHPLGRFGEPEDIGWGVVYLASDEAKFVTGTTLHIDGGYLAR